MTEYSDLLRFLGLVRRAGKMTLGAEFAAKEKLIIITEDFSEKTSEKLRATGNEVITIPVDMETIGSSLGAGRVGALGISDKNFIKRIKELISAKS